MQQYHILEINDDTPPSFETEVAKWWLLDKGEHLAVWLWESKKDGEKNYLITDITHSKVVREYKKLEDTYAFFSTIEATGGLEWEEDDDE